MTRSQLFQRIDELDASIDSLSVRLASATDEDEIDTLEHELTQTKAEKVELIDALPDSR